MQTIADLRQQINLYDPAQPVAHFCYLENMVVFSNPLVIPRLNLSGRSCRLYSNSQELPYYFHIRNSSYEYEDPWQGISSHTLFSAFCLFVGGVELHASANSTQKLKLGGDRCKTARECEFSCWGLSPYFGSENENTNATGSLDPVEVEA